MRFTGIDHVVFRVTDPERTVAWWRDTFDLQPERLDEWRRQEVLFVSVRVTPTTILDLFTGDRPEGQVDNVDHVAFVLEDVDLDELAASGRFEVESGPHDLWGARGQGRGVYLLDPDGNRIELRTY
ncbi:VOC family protein [Aquihabitans sp. G128]|uniref:VOC family protein n=1 Tax=Aquihabitans sp. G128 TaxID=2849779 RepID=UPI001C24420D|nr:VOC family protein [Aquihabitans sp. G128]QXC61755.1 VOC family protein [Aquihabitans sp. G128]